MRWIGWFLLVWLAASPAAADWHRATSENYIVHADLDPETLRETVQVMEAFHELLEAEFPSEAGIARRASIYLDRNNGSMSDIVGWDVNGIKHYTPEFTGAYTFFRNASKLEERFAHVFWGQAQIYFANSSYATAPAWIRSGFASFYSSAYPDQSSGAFVIGTRHQRTRFRGEATPEMLNRLFSRHEWYFNQSEYRFVFTLSDASFRVLLNEPGHAGLLESYLDAYTAGLSIEDALARLGSLDQLSQAINRISSADEATLRAVPMRASQGIPIEIAPMTPDEVRLVPLRMWRLSEVNLPWSSSQLQRLTRRYPESAEVWYEYAANEFARVRRSRGDAQVFRGFGFSSGGIIVVADPYSDRIAWEAVNRALALDPDHPAARVLRAEIRLGRLVIAGDDPGSERYDELRAELLPLASDPDDHPLAAALYHQSYVEQGIVPALFAFDLLARAFDANPAVEEFRYAYAVALSRRGDEALASQLLRSMLNTPEYSEAARRALAAR